MWKLFYVDFENDGVLREYIDMGKNFEGDWTVEFQTKEEMDEYIEKNRDRIYCPIPLYVQI